MLPDKPGAVWPPQTLNAITAKHTEWSAWYAGDTTSLHNLYGQAGNPTAAVPAYGGIAGAAQRYLPHARWFWGTPTPEGQRPAKLHVPIAADIATTSADLLFGEQLAITPPDAKADQGGLEQLVTDLDLFPTLLEAGEIAAALGGAYLRVVWDDEVAGHPLVDVVHADSAVPVFRHGRLWSVTFWNIVERDGNIVWRHLEEHSHGRIEHGLYRGSDRQIGARVPLDYHPATAGLTVDDDQGIATEWPGLTAAYLPNMRPQRLWRTDPVGRNLGRSDLDGVEPLMDALDETYTSLMRDLRLGKARIVVPENQLQAGGPGQGASYDLEREIYAAVAPIAGSAQNATLQAQLMQPALRVDEHLRTAYDLVQQIVRQAGYSAATFGLDDKAAAATATEVRAREQRSMSTREKKTRYASAAIADVLHAAQWIGHKRFGAPAPHKEPPAVEFPATAQPSMTETAQTLQALRAAAAASTQTRVRMVHPDWTDAEVQTEAARIMAEDGMNVPDLGPAPLIGDYLPDDQAGQLDSRTYEDDPDQQ